MCETSLQVPFSFNLLLGVIDVVWSEIKQIGLIDSIFRNFYIPPIIFGNVARFIAVFGAYVCAQPYPSHPTAQKGGFALTESSA